MSVRPSSRGLSALLWLAAFSASAQSPAPQQLPPVVVTANPLGSELLDLVAPVSVLSGERLQLSMQPTLGEIVAGLVGVASTYYGPNASRPVIRGFDGDRIRVLQNGVGSLDASATSVDHAVALDTLTVKRIEVVRGPATLLYGPNALGGVVNTIDGRIPVDVAEGATGGVDLRYASPATERSGAAALDFGLGTGLALHVDGFKRRTDDLRIPDYARSARLREIDPLPPDEEEARDRLPNSASDSSGGAFGIAYSGARGNLGASVTHFDSDYGTVAEEDVTIRMKQTRVDLAGEWREPVAALSSVAFRWAHSDYQHTEYEGAETGTVFRNKGWEGRVDAKHKPIGLLEGAFGIQATDFDFSALGEEGFLPRTTTRAIAAFLFEEARYGWGRLQGGARIDRTEVSAEEDPDFGPASKRRFTTASASFGVTVDIAKDLAIVGSFVYAERPPTYQELYADGPHVATGIVEVGDRTLDPERSTGFDVALRQRAGAFTGRLGYFYSRIRDYIGLFPTGEDDPGSGLPIYVYRPVRATFQGVEAEGALELARLASGSWNLELKADWLRATDDDSGEPLPRIAPLRFGGALAWSADRYDLRLDVLRVQSQDRVAPNELPTDGYTMVDASVSFRLTRDRYGLTAFVKGTNLLDEDARNHVSFLKDIAPLGARGVTVGLRGTF